MAEYLTHGMPVKLDAVKGEWFKVGVAVQNDSERGPIAVSVEIEGVEVRIAETEETEEVTDSKAKEIKAENIVKEWTTSEISELFKRKTDEDCTLITCASVYDFAYDRVGAILYTDSKEGYVHVAFMDKEGNMQHCGVEATIIDSPEFTYLGNGEVTFKVSSKVDV